MKNKQKIIFSTIILAQLFFTTFLLLSAFSDHSSKTTIQKALPLPYSSFENLYFNTKEDRFLALGTNVFPPIALAKIQGRTMGFDALEKFPKSYNSENVMSETTLILLEFPHTAGYCKHFFHLLEHVVGLWSFDGSQHSDDVKLILLPYTGDFDKGPNNINAHLLMALYPNARIIGWQTFLDENNSGLVRFERAVISDRSLTQFSPACQKINKHLGEALPYLSQEALDKLSAKVNKYAKTPNRVSDELTVTLLQRPMPRTLTPELEQKLINAISAIPGVSLKVSDFAKIPFKDQVNIIGNTDVLISVHGNGLSHILFLPSNAAAIEILPAHVITLDYMLLANARNLDFLSLSSSDGVISREQAYTKGASGDVGTTITQLDIEPILAFIKQHSIAKANQ